MESDIKPTVPTLMKVMRINKGWSQKDLAIVARTTPNTISMLESGILLRRISSILGVKPEDLLTRGARTVLTEGETPSQSSKVTHDVQMITEYKAPQVAPISRDTEEQLSPQDEEDQFDINQASNPLGDSNATQPDDSPDSVAILAKTGTRRPDHLKGDIKYRDGEGNPL